MKAKKGYKICANKDCKREFKLYKSTDKYCSPNCLKEGQGYTSIKKVSDKRAAQNEAYLLLRDMYLKKHQVCEANLQGCTNRSTEIHHANQRHNDRLCDVKYFVAICRNCHNVAHDQNIKLK